MEFEEILGSITLCFEKDAPTDWMFCDGQVLKISDYPALHSIFGNKYGGDNTTTFALPKLKKISSITKYIICVNGVYPERNHY